MRTDSFAAALALLARLAQGFDFDKLVARQMRPPIIPKIKSNKDLSNFDDYSSHQMPEVEPYVDDGSNWDAEF